MSVTPSLSVGPAASASAPPSTPSSAPNPQAAPPMSALRKELTSRLANHQLLFVVGQSYSGTTATFSLVASSPQVGTLCSAGTWVCEDTMLFIRAGVFSDAGRWNPMTGQDEKWLRGLDKLTHVWDLRQPVCIPSVYVYTSRCVPFRSRTLTGHTHDCRFSLTRVRPTLLACIPSRGQRVASPFQHSLSCSPARRFPSMPNTDGMRINGV